MLKDATHGRGVDVILDMVGGDYLARNLKLAALNGRIVIIAVLGGPKADLNILPILMKCLVVTGSVLRPRSDAEKAAIVTSLQKRVWPLIELGRWVADAVHPHDAAEPVVRL